MQKLTPFIWLEQDALGAAKHYKSVFGEDNVRMEGHDAFHDPWEHDVMIVSLTIFGVDFKLMAAGKHQEHNDMISFEIMCKDQVEVDLYWNGLIADGGAESQCGWCIDKFGVRWQIVPERYYELMSDPDSAKQNRVMEAMFKMKKLIVADLEAAAEETNG